MTLGNICGANAVRQFTGPLMTLPEPESRKKQREQLRTLEAEEKEQLKRLIAAATEEQSAWESRLVADAGLLEKVPRRFRALLKVSEPERTKDQRKKLLDYYLGTRSEIRARRTRLSVLQKRLEGLRPQTTLTMVELKAPRTTRVFKRGNFLDPGPRVEPGVPKIFPPLAADALPNRLGLARWLCDPDNPLVSRVTVNRWWAELFGQGLVATLEDFGTQGEPPTHPKLLDWLATEFIRRNWSMKAMHRLIVTSATYRQSSKLTATRLRDDPDGKLYARGPRFRMEAERIRDNALAASGLLHLKMEGVPVRPPQPAAIWNVTGVVDNAYRTSEGADRYRRGVYTVWRRSSPFASFVIFDAPDRGSTCVRRPRTNTPLQALTLMNDSVYVEAAFALAARILRDRPDAEPRDQAIYGFRLCLARPPRREEADHLHTVYKRELRRHATDAPALEKLLKGRDIPDDVNHRQLTAWFYVATILLNLDETITKG